MSLFAREASWKTSLTPEQAAEALNRIVAPGRLLAIGADQDPRPFRGAVTGSTFRVIHRVVSRNSFAPVLCGTLEPASGGAAVRLTMVAHDGPMTLVGVSLVLATLFALHSLVSGALETPALAVLGLPYLVPLLGWLAFSLELPRSLALLKAHLPERGE